VHDFLCSDALAVSPCRCSPDPVSIATLAGSPVAVSLSDAIMASYSAFRSL
jgi:hypothetical protein